MLGWPQPVVSKHLGVLLQVGLVVVRRDGRQRLYSVNGEKLKPASTTWVAAFERFWDHHLDSIKRRAEQKEREKSANPPYGENFQTEGVMTNMAMELPEQFLAEQFQEGNHHQAASAETVFEAMLDQNGPGCDMPDGTSMAMKLEPWCRAADGIATWETTLGHFGAMCR